MSFSHRKKMLDVLGNPPLLTVLIAATCILIFVFQISADNPSAICLLPSLVVSKFQVYRIFTFPFFHAGFMHIFFNIIAWVMLAKDFERSLGTLPASYAVFILFIPLTAIFHMCVAFLLDGLAGTAFRNDCAVGISGVLFAILVVNIEASGTPAISFFGCFNIPSRWYPWILALLLQLISPALSFLGHLSGIVLGYALALGYLRGISPPDSKLEQIEENLGLIRWPLWQPVPVSFFSSGGMFALPQTNAQSGGSFSERVQGAWRRVTSWFSRSPETTSTAGPFAGQGRALGGDVSDPPAGRVPPTSRLLREAEEAASERATEPDTSSETAQQPAGDPTAAKDAEQHMSEKHVLGES